MLQAIIFICAVEVGGSPECNDFRAIFTDVAPDRYVNDEECQRGAIEYLHTVDFSGVLAPDGNYQVIISCRIPT
jgi:hypothetical protein